MNTLIQSHKQHQNWLLAIDVINDLNELCLQIRSHRGTTTAQLEGDKFFEAITETTAQTISEMLVSLDDKNAIFISFEAHEDFFSVVQQWLQIQLHWSEWDAYKNFETHSLMLAGMQKLICGFSNYYIKQQGPDSDKGQLTHFLLHTHINTMESIARLRGLGCFYCAKQYLSTADKKVMRIEIKQSHLLWSQRAEALMNLSSHIHLPLLQAAEANLLNAFMADFIQLLESTLKNNQYTPNGSEIFNAGSRILSVMNRQFSLGLDDLKQYLPVELDQWIKQQLEPSHTQEGL